MRHYSPYDYHHAGGWEMIDPHFPEVSGKLQMGRDAEGNYHLLQYRFSQNYLVILNIATGRDMMVQGLMPANNVELDWANGRFLFFDSAKTAEIHINGTVTILSKRPESTEERFARSKGSESRSMKLIGFKVFFATSMRCTLM